MIFFCILIFLVAPLVTISVCRAMQAPPVAFPPPSLPWLNISGGRRFYNINTNCKKLPLSNIDVAIIIHCRSEPVISDVCKCLQSYFPRYMVCWFRQTWYGTDVLKTFPCGLGKLTGQTGAMGQIGRMVRVANLPAASANAMLAHSICCTSPTPKLTIISIHLQVGK